MKKPSVYKHLMENPFTVDKASNITMQEALKK